MRLSTTQFFQQGISSIVDKQAELVDTQNHLSSGKRIMTPSDDPSGAVQVLRLSNDIASINQYGRNIDNATAQISQEDDVLKNVGNSLQRIRELVVQANNDTLDQSNRSAIAKEIDSLKTGLLSLANSRDASGEYIFAGFQVRNQPFTEQAGSVQYKGDQGQRFVRIGSSTQIAVRTDGSTVFQAIPSGNGVFSVSADATNTGTGVVHGSSTGDFVPDTYTVDFSQPVATDPMKWEARDSSGAAIASGDYKAGDTIIFKGVQLTVNGAPADGDKFTVTPAADQDVFTTVEQVVNSLNAVTTAPASLARMHNQLNSALDNIDGAINHFLDVRADVGVRLDRLDSQKSINANSLTQLQTSLSSVQDLDYASAISKFNEQQAALQAAQKAYTRISGLSLFNFL